MENQRLRERVVELEKEIADLKAGSGMPGQRLTQLLRKKDVELEARHAQAEAKAEEAERTADKLSAKNEELLNSMAALRLYQLMFENDPHGLVGVSAEGVIIQFNSSAIRFFGYDLHKLRMQDISELALPGGSLNLKALFEQAMSDGESEQAETEQEGRRVLVNCYRLEDIRGQRGAVFRLSEAQEK